MTDQTDAGRILAFADQLASGQEEATGRSIARARNWLDADGAPTEEGRRLLAELKAQRDMRSAYRLPV